MYHYTTYLLGAPYSNAKSTGTDFEIGVKPYANMVVDY